MFRRFRIPTPFQVGPVNAYLAGDTLIDPGPESDEAWARLLEQLEGEGLAPKDVSRVLITHPHPDHFGLARRFHEAGATVLASGPTADIVGDFAGRLEYEQSFFVEFLQRHGVSEGTAGTVTDLPEVFLDYGPDCPVDRTLEDGDEIAVDGRTVTVERVKGHAPGELVFTYEVEDTRRAVVGDHVLADVTPNPWLQPPPEPGGGRPRALIRFNRSLERLASRDLDRLLPGHGTRIDDPTGRIRAILDAHERRTAEVRDLVDGPTTAIEVMEGLFENLAVTEYFGGLSEAVGHLDVLEERGEVVREERGGMVIFEPVG
jgi:glyoxylase-like metal-dependent hydrolase (beta-lactamase superfamily II)